MYNKQDSINTAYTYIQGLRSQGHTFNGYPVYNVTKDDLNVLWGITDRYGFPGEWLVNLINFESGKTFNPAIQNSIGATGLIQFLPSTATGLGTTTAALKAMTFQQQLSYVDRYLATTLRNHLGITGTVPGDFTQGDLFMAIFYPAAVGQANYIFPNNVQTANAGIATPYDYAQKALMVAVFPLSMVPYSLADVKKKFGAVTTYTKKHWVIMLVVVGGILIILAVSLFALRKKIADTLTVPA